MTEFNLRGLVREVCDESTSADPAVLAKEVSLRIGPADQEAALEQALRLVVHNVITRDRGAHPDTSGGQTATDTHAAGGPSAKVARIREAYRQRRLNERYAVGPDPSDWKFLGACTAHDLITTPTNGAPDHDYCRP